MHPRHEHLATSARGFSLVELLAAMAMLGFTIAIGAYAVNSNGWRVSAAATGVARQLELARSRSAFENHHVRVSFDTSPPAIRVHADLNSDGTVESSIGETVTVVPLSQSATGIDFSSPSSTKGLDNLDISSAITFAGSPPTVIFRPTGDSTTGVIYMIPHEDLGRNDRSNMRAVSVDAATGRIRIWRYNTKVGASPPWRLAR